MLSLTPPRHTSTLRKRDSASGMAGVDDPKGRRRNRFNVANRRREADVADRGHTSGWGVRSADDCGAAAGGGCANGDAGQLHS